MRPLQGRGSYERVPGALPPATELRPCRALGDGYDAQVALLRLAPRQEFLPIMGSSKAINAQNDSQAGYSEDAKTDSAGRQTPSVTHYHTSVIDCAE